MNRQVNDVKLASLLDQIFEKLDDVDKRLTHLESRGPGVVHDFSMRGIDAESASRWIRSHTNSIAQAMERARHRTSS